jgi:hypothetical protein
MIINTTPYYCVKLCKSLTAEDWFVAVERLATEFAERGYVLHEFGTTHEIDCAAVRESGGRSYFEGHVVHPPDDGWKHLFEPVLEAAGMPVQEVILDAKRWSR